ncbi:DEAD/DEAH box helicase family protein [Eubacterium xylanophilum]|uniref:DEAD/DEAH box helicase family protein n=1 Tax=Eubacterium xylanophilum TaxID=39497 RepID=UPI00047CF701|nr:DEAD/DEAH box helicase family protein [Eubacterium xylanophilum]
MSFRDLDIKIRYRSGIHDFPKDFLIPVLSKSKIYKRGTGYFSTSALVQLSIGLFNMAKKGGLIQLVCSPNLDAEDIKAIQLGYKTRDEVIEKAIVKGISDPVNYFEEERLNLIATLIAEGTLDIKIAFMEDENGFRLYHEKMAVFVDEYGNKISYAGSPNESQNGLEGNFESIYTFCSWKDASQIEAVCTAESDFDDMWDNRTTKLHVVDFPKIAVDKLMIYKKDRGIDWEVDNKQFRFDELLVKPPKFFKPDGVELHKYQELAVKKWIKNDYQGIFDMCTGSGKTYTALAATVEFSRRYNERIAVIIVCPYIHLVSQWEEDVVNWCRVPIIIAHSKASCDWKLEMRKAYKRFKRDNSPFVCITTNDTFSGDEMQNFITRFDKEKPVLIIVDEAHNFGSNQMISVMPWNIVNRIALSATINRYMDKSGTNKIVEFFGEKCVEYSLEQAIKDGKLVHYEYYPIPIALSEQELGKYRELSRKLKKYIVIQNGKMRISDAGKPVIYERTRLLAGAENKIPLLMELFEDYKNDNNILVYCGATGIEEEESGTTIRQIDLVTQKLQVEFGMSVKRFTAEENLKDRENIKKYFAQGQYQVITAIKCLDEGVNIPGIKTAFIMSSSRNPKEFVQRRGRLLRKSNNKNKAVIYDFITLPRELDDVIPSDFDEDRTIIIGEVARMLEFGRLADNPQNTDLLVNQIMESYDSYFDAENEIEKMEEYYGE